MRVGFWITVAGPLLWGGLACSGAFVSPRDAAQAAGIPAAPARADEARLARRELERAIAADPFDYPSHARLAELTGRAPRTPAASLRESVERAERHPYDPRALLGAGEWLARDGRTAEALTALEASVFLADLDPAAADAALALLPSLAPEWRQRRVVRAHVFVDAPVREQPGWRFAVRSLWLDLSVALEPLLGARFVVTALGAFEEVGSGSALEPMLDALVNAPQMQSRSGLIAWLTGSAAPDAPAAKRGVAEYLGRHLVVRWRPPGGVHRALAHEIVHLFGGIHVVGEVDSLMNVGGRSRRLDALNADIVRAIAPRGFDGGGIASDVLARIDRRRAIEAFEAALRVNLAFRKLDLDALSADSRLAPRRSAPRLRRATALDAHMADVSSFVAKLHQGEGRLARAVVLYEVAAHLYGARTPRGREAQALADQLRESPPAER